MIKKLLSVLLISTMLVQSTFIVTSSALLSFNGSPPPGYTYCSAQFGSKTFIDTVDLAYGANGKFNYLYGKIGKITFNDKTFGNPAPLYLKKGYYKLSTFPTLKSKTLFILKTATTGLSSPDLNYMSLVPVSKRISSNPAVLLINSENDLNDNIYLKDYLKRYKPDQIFSIDFNSSIPNVPNYSISSKSPVELSTFMATKYWSNSYRVVLVNDDVSISNYPNLLQASSLASKLNVPLLYYNSTKASLVSSAIGKLGATEVISVGTNPINLATKKLTNSVEIINYLSTQNIPTDYFAMTNPNDINHPTGAKLSLTATLIAANRNGIVIPINNASSAYLVNSQLKGIYKDVGKYPNFLSIIGTAASIPLHYISYSPDLITGNLPSDFDYSNVDSDDFPDISIGRLMSYNVFDQSLLTSRISTYSRLYDGSWEKTAIDVGNWTRSISNPLVANYGYALQDMASVDLLNTKTPLNAALIFHNEHSYEKELGKKFYMNSTNILSPATLVSGGCSTGAIDRGTDGQLIINQMFKLGLVAYMGGTRNLPAIAATTQEGFINYALTGEPIGTAYKRAITNLSIVPSNQNAMTERRNQILFGDPAMQLKTPSTPKVNPTAFTITPGSLPNTDILEVKIPSTTFIGEVAKPQLDDWKWTNKLYSASIAGVYSDTYWGSGYNKQDQLFTVNYNTDRNVLKVEPLYSPAAPLGMATPFSIDTNQNSTKNIIWNVRVMDFNQVTGTISKRLDSAYFKITYEPLPTPPAPPIYPSGTNLALMGTASQSTDDAPASRAIDGNTDGDFANNSVSSTNYSGDDTESWRLDLGTNQTIGQIKVWNRTDGYQNYLDNYTISILSEAGGAVWSNNQYTFPNPVTTFTPGNIVGRYLEIYNNKIRTPLQLAEVQVLSP